MLSVVFHDCHVNCNNAECRRAERHFAKYRYAECHFANYRYTECRGAVCENQHKSDENSSLKP
jgi:hypothetical protein